jgi:hypothetical protein
MQWPFGRRRARAAKLKEGRPSAATDALQRSPSQRTRRPRRPMTSSRSTPSLHAGDKDPFGHNPPHSSAEDITALPTSHRRQQHSPHLLSVPHHHVGHPYYFHSPSHASLPTAKERGKLQRPQSLRRGLPNESSLVRRKSSKKRKDIDHAREDEIRSMTLPMPQKRPAAPSAGMLRRDSKKIKAAFTHPHPPSNVSLPPEDSIHSSMSGNSELRAFRVSAFDIFAPRPTIRYSVGSQYTYSGERTSLPAHQEKAEGRRERRHVSGREEKQWKRTSRIDDLADELDAGALRDILERDKRRQDKKAKADQERLQRRLARRTEKQNAAPAGTPPVALHNEPQDMVGLGIDKEESVPMEGVRSSTPPWLHPSSPPPMHRLETQQPLTPTRLDNSQLPTPVESPVEDMVVSDAQAIRYSKGSVSGFAHTRGPSNVSQMPDLLSEKLAREDPAGSVERFSGSTSGSIHPTNTIDTTTTSIGRRSSEGRRMSAFASFFRRGKRSSQQEMGRTTPSEISFSNTSRESMSRQPLPAHLVATMPTQPIQIKKPSGAPRRTMSKFREDLPEFPHSPPDSLVSSTDVPHTSAIAARRRKHVPSDLRVGSVVNARSDSPISPGLPVTNKMSQSLASVDSEGSWLSGRPVKRISNKSMIRSSVASSAVHQNHEYNNSFEELGMADDEYFRRLNQQPEDRFNSNRLDDHSLRKASSTAMATLDAAAESDEERTPCATRSGEEEHIKGGIARQPTIIHRNARAKSIEGLLTFPDADKFNPEEMHQKLDREPESPPSDSDQAFVQRARSVDLGKQHVRHLSAGSAKLLDIQKRS